MVKLPYGISNFASLVTQGYYYVDRTPYLEKLENLSTKYHFLLRPRRFGKSLWISTLQYYYGKEHTEKFNSLFGNFYIGANPTPLSNSYCVLKFDFSGIYTETYETTYRGFSFKVKKGIEEFLNTYFPKALISEKDEILAQPSPEIMISDLFTFIAKSGNHQIYVLIDEYDHFTNELFSFRSEEFEEIVSQNGYVRKFYEEIKIGTQEGIVDRFFAAGVSPVTLDNLTSGFNIGTNLSMDEGVNEMLGFTEKEVIIILMNVGLENKDQEEVLNELRIWYNGYLFNKHSKNRIYNADMVLFFANEYQKLQRIPDSLLDTNISSDYSKIRQLFKLGGQEQDRWKLLQKLLDEGSLSVEITREFSFLKQFTQDDFLSLLFYMGLLTIKDVYRSNTRLKIPNEVIRLLYYKYFAEILERKSGFHTDPVDIRATVEALAWENDPQPIIKLVEKTLQELSNRDWPGFDEKHLKAILITYLYSTKLYHIKSEYELKQKYPDLILRRRPPYDPPYQFIIELKFLHKKDIAKLKETTQKGRTQLKSYLLQEEIKQMENLKAWLLIFVGTEAKVVEEIL